MITDPDERKARPITTGVLDYFPDALIEVARVSMAGNTQHDLGPLHWDKSRSTDEADALVRHLLERGTTDTDGIRHTAKVAWRALALLQRELDAEATKDEPDEPDEPDMWEPPEDTACPPQDVVRDNVPCDGSCPDGRYCPEHGDLVKEDAMAPDLGIPVRLAEEITTTAYEDQRDQADANALVDKVVLVGGPMHGQITVMARGVTEALGPFPGRYERASDGAKFAHWRSAHAS